jgi:hypothetical protein
MLWALKNKIPAKMAKTNNVMIVQKSTVLVTHERTRAGNLIHIWEPELETPDIGTTKDQWLSS